MVSKVVWLTHIKRPLCENAEQDFKRCSIGFWLEQTQQEADLHAHMSCFYSLHINVYMYVRACLGLVGLVNSDLDQFLKCDHTRMTLHIYVYT